MAEEENQLGDFGFSSESDVDCCRGCGSETGHKPDCSFFSGGAALGDVRVAMGQQAEPPGDK